MSITAGTDLVVRDSVFQRTQGTLPETGLDIEPDRGDAVRRVQVRDNRFLDNAGGGLQIGPALRDRKLTFVSDVDVRGNQFTGNGVGGLNPNPFVIQLSATDQGRLQGNQLQDNRGVGIGVLYSHGARVRGNSVRGTRVAGDWIETGAGIILEKDVGTVCTGNTVVRNEGYGIFTWKSDGRRSSTTSCGTTGAHPEACGRAQPSTQSLVRHSRAE